MLLRVLGGLLSAYDLSGEPMFLKKAQQITDRLLPAWNTPSGIPYGSINLATGDSNSPGWSGVYNLNHLKMWMVSWTLQYHPIPKSLMLCYLFPFPLSSSSASSFHFFLLICWFFGSIIFLFPGFDKSLLTFRAG